MGLPALEWEGNKFDAGSKTLHSKAKKPMKSKMIILFILLFILSCKDDDHSENNSVLRVKWSSEINRQTGVNFEQPLIDGAQVYFANGKKIECREVESGKLIWTYLISEDVDYNGCNFTVNSNLIVINHAFKTVGLNKSTGEEKWVSPDAGEFRDMGSTSCLTETGFFRGGWNTPGKINEYSSGTGTLVRQFDFRFPDEKVQSLIVKGNILLCTTIKNVDTPILVDGKTVTGDFGELVGFDLTTGERLYSIFIQPSQFYSSESEVFSNFDFWGEDVFCAFKNGKILRVHTTTGKVKWMTNPSEWGYNKPVGLIRVHLSADGKKLFSTGNMDNWLCVNAETGALIYFKQKSDYNSVIDGSSFDGMRYIFKPAAQTTYEWYIIDINTGEIVEIFDQPNESIYSQDINNGYVAAIGGKTFFMYQIVK